MAGSRPWLKYVGIGCGGAIVLLIGFIAVVFLTVGKLTAEPERVVGEFLAAAAAGDYAKAHGYFSVPLKEAQPLEAFTASAKAQPSLFKVADTTFSSRGIDAQGIATLEGTAKLEAGTTVPCSFKLSQENGAWKLLGYHVGSTD